MAYTRRYGRGAGGNPLVKENASVQTRLAALRGVGAPVPETQTDDPGFLAKMFGWTDTLGAMNRASMFNRADALDKEGYTPSALAKQALAGIVAPIASSIYYGMNGPLNPLEEAGKAIRGERTVSTADIDRNFVAPQVARAFGQESLPYKVYDAAPSRFVRSIGGDIASDPLVAVDFGATGATKVLAGTKAAKLVDLSDHAFKAANAVDKAADAAELAGRMKTLADHGLDVAKHGDELTGFVTGAKRVGDLSAPLQRDMMSALRRESAKDLGAGIGVHMMGTGIPGTETLGAKVVQPVLEKLAYGAKDTLRRSAAVRSLEKGWGRSTIVEAAQAGKEVSKEALRAGMRKGAGISAVGSARAVDTGVKMRKDVPDAVRVATTVGLDEARAPYIEPMRKAYDQVRRANEAIKAGYSRLKLKAGSAKPGVADDVFEAANLRMDDLTARRDALTSEAEALMSDRRGALNQWKPNQTPTARAAKQPAVVVAQAAKPLSKTAESRMPWVRAAREQLGAEAQEDVMRQMTVSQASGEPGLLEHVREVLSGRRISDASMLTPEEAMAARGGAKVPLREEVVRYRDAKLPVAYPSKRFAPEAMTQEAIIESLHGSFPGIYDEIGSVADLDAAIGNAATLSGKRVRLPGMPKASEVMRLADENPEVLDELLVRRAQQAMKTGDEATYDEAISAGDAFLAWDEARKGAPRPVAPEDFGPLGDIRQFPIERVTIHDAEAGGKPRTLFAKIISEDDKFYRVVPVDESGAAKTTVKGDTETYGLSLVQKELLTKREPMVSDLYYGKLVSASKESVQSKAYKATSATPAEATQMLTEARKPPVGAMGLDAAGNAVPPLGDVRVPGAVVASVDLPRVKGATTPEYDTLAAHMDDLRGSLDPDMADLPNSNLKAEIDRASKRAAELAADATPEEIGARQSVVESLVEELNTRRALAVLDDYLPTMKEAGVSGMGKSTPFVERLAKRAVKTADTRLMAIQRELIGVTGELRGLTRTHGRFVAADELAAEAGARLTQLQSDVTSKLVPRLRESLLSRGFAPEDVDKAVTNYMETQLPAMEGVLSGAEAIGIPEKQAFGVGALGYMPQEEKSARSWITQKIDQFRGRPDLTNEEIRSLGMTPPPEPESGTTFASYVTSTARPAQAHARSYATHVERIGQNVSTELDPAVLIPNRMSRQGRNAGRAYFEDTFIKAAAVTEPDTLTALKGKNPALYAEQRLRWLADNSLVEHSVTRNGVMGKATVPAEWERGFKDLAKTLNSSVEIGGLLRDYGKVMAVWKRAATTYNPGFHGRNALSNMFLLGTEGIGNPDGVSDGMRIVKSEMDGTFNPDELLDLGKAGKVRLGDFMDEMRLRTVRNDRNVRADAAFAVDEQIRRETGKWWSYASDAKPWDPRKALRDPRRNLEELGQVVEDGMRLGGAINAIRHKGLDYDSAADLAIRAMYDYSPEAKGRIESTWGRQLVPFIAWQRANVPHMLEWALKNPGKAGVLGKIRNAAFATTGTDPTILPDYMKEQGSFPLPFTSGDVAGVTGGLMGTKGSNDWMMLNPNIPLQDLGRLKPTEQGVGDLLMGGLTPALKIPLERAFNKSSFTGLPLTDYTGELTRTHGILQNIDQQFYGQSWWETIKSGAGMATQFDAKTKEPYLAASPEFNQVVNALPWVANLGKSLDTTPDSEFKLISWLSGVKMAPASQDKMLLNALRARDTELSDEERRLRARGLKVGGQ